MKAQILRLTTIAALALAPAAFAAEEEKGAKAGKEGAAKGAASASGFIKAAAADGMAEVKLGALAAEKATDPGVKEFGSMMAGDHGKANEELKALAASKNVEIPEKLDAKHQAVHDKLAKMSGAEFDKAYMSEMVKAHKKSVELFEKASKSDKDPEVKAFATKTLPVLQTHLEKAQSLAGAAGGKGGKEKKEGA